MTLTPCEARMLIPQAQANVRAASQVYMLARAALEEARAALEALECVERGDFDDSTPLPELNFYGVTSTQGRAWSWAL